MALIDDFPASSPERAPRLLAALNALVFGVLFAGLALHAGQDHNWDLLNYHHYNAFAWLNERWGFDVQPAQRQTFFSPYLDGFAYALTEAFGPRTAAVGVAVLQALKAPCLLLITWWLARAAGFRRIPSAILAQVLTLLALAAPGHLAQLGSSFGDALTATVVLAGLAVLALPLRPGAGPASTSTLLLAGGLLGVAAGLKLTNTPFLLAAGAAVFVVTPGAGPRMKATAAVLAGGALGLALSYGPWGWKLYTELGNPFFPQFNHLFASDFVGNSSYRDPRFDPPGLAQALFYPAYYNVWALDIAGQRFADLRMAVALFVVPLGLVLAATTRQEATERSRLVTALFVFSAVAYALWLWVFPVVRYIMVLELLLPALLLALYAALPKRTPLHATALGLALIVAVASAWPSWTKPRPFGPRQAWSEDPFPAGWPGPERLENAMVLVFGGEPMSFLIPAAPRSTRFVRDGGNILSRQGYQSLEEADDNGLGRHIAALITAHEGPLFAFYTEGEQAEAEYRLTYRKLSLVESGCQPVISRFRKAQWLCPVMRRSSGTSALE